MVDSMNRIWTLLAAVAALAALLTASRNEPEAERTWRFQGKEGIVEVRLTLYASNNETKKIASLQIYSPDGVPRSVPEEAGFIATVLDNLPSVGVNLQSLDSISFRFSEPEAVKRVAAYAAPSKEWREALRTKRVSKIYPLVTSFLNKSHAYQEWDSVFKEHGLTIRAVGVEEVLVEPFSKAGVSCPTGMDCTNLLVPRDALVQMNITPK